MNGAELNQLAEVRALAQSGSARAIREAARVSLREMAGAVGASKSAIHRWETGSRSPRGDTALAYRAVLQELLKR